MKNNRYELKYLTLPVLFDKLASSLSLSNFLYFEKFPKRKVHSLYFDLPNSKCLNDINFGSISKFKVRARWYNNDPSKTFLEIKKIDALVGSKIVIDLGAICFNDWKHFHQTLLAKTNSYPQYHPFFGNPVVYVSYDRNYFCSMIMDYEKIRITLDRNVEYSTCSLIGNSLTFNKTAKDHNMVVELKFPTEQIKEAASISRILDLTLCKNSKFFNAIQSLR